MKKTRNCIAAAILSGTMMLLTSCTALSQFEQLGLSGWLELGSNPEDTNIPATSIVTSALPSLTPEISEDATTNDNFITSLPTIPKSPTMAEILEVLPQKDFGRIPVMLSYVGSPSILMGNDAALISQTIKGIEQKYNSSPTLYSERTQEELEELLNSNEYFADLLLLPLEDAIRYAKEGKLMAVRTEYLSAGVQGAYYESVFSDFTIKEDNYFLLPSVSTAYESSVVIFCNTDLLSRSADEDNIVSFTKDGKWDLHLLYKYLRLAQEKLGEGYILADSAVSEEIITNIFTSSLKEGDELEMAKFILENLRFSDKETAKNDFYEGNTLFYIGHTSDLRDFRESGDSWAILPIPKKQQETDYPLYYDGEKLYVFALPAGAVNTEAALALVDALALCGRYEQKYNFIESMYTLYIRQRDSIPYTGVSRFDGKVISPLWLSYPPEEEPENTELAPTPEDTTE